MGEPRGITHRLLKLWSAYPNVRLGVLAFVACVAPTVLWWGAVLVLPLFPQPRTPTAIANYEGIFWLITCLVLIFQFGATVAFPFIVVFAAWRSNRDNQTKTHPEAPIAIVAAVNAQMRPSSGRLPRWGWFLLPTAVLVVGLVGLSVWCPYFRLHRITQKVEGWGGRVEAEHNRLIGIQLDGAAVTDEDMRYLRDLTELRRPFT